MIANLTLSAPRRSAHPFLVLLSGHGGVAALTLLRNIIVARLIGVENFGIAATFAILVSAVEMVTTLGAQQMIVQDADGEDVDFQSSLHFVQLGRGIVGAAAIYAIAKPVAAFFGTPDLAWAYRTLALVPLLTGLSHLDAWRYHRNKRFGPSIWVQLGPAFLSLMLVWPLMTKFGDFRVLLVAIITQYTGMAMMSHLVAERRYLAGFCADHLRRAFRFGWPIALNGLLLLAVFHGEKLIVGHLRGSESLALLAMGFSLTLTPALIVGRSLQSYLLPQLTSVRNNPGRFHDLAASVLRFCLLAGCTLGIVLAIASPTVPWILGRDFVPLMALFPILAALHGIRVVKSGVTVIALAQGATTNATLGNLPRVAALPVIYASLNSGGSLETALWIATAAEVVGLVIAYALLRRVLPAR